MKVKFKSSETVSASPYDFIPIKWANTQMVKVNEYFHKTTKHSDLGKTNQIFGRKMIGFDF